MVTLYKAFISTFLLCNKVGRVGRDREEKVMICEGVHMRKKKERKRERGEKREREI